MPPSRGQAQSAGDAAAGGGGDGQTDPFTVPGQDPWETWQTVKSKGKQDRPAREPGQDTPARRSSGSSGGVYHCSVRDVREVAGRKLHVSGLTASTTDEQLRKAFGHHGSVEDCHVVKGKGFGFVTFEEEAGANMALRQGSIRIDGKLCDIRTFHVARGDAIDDATHSAARAEVNEFLNRHEADLHVRSVVQAVDARTALRVLRALESSPNFRFIDRIVMAEIRKASNATLSSGLEGRVEAWVASLGLEEEMRDRLQCMLLGQRPEEIEHVLELGTQDGWCRELRKCPDPLSRVLAIVRKYKRIQTDNDIRAFRLRFSFDEMTENLLRELTSERARRLMQNWRPAASAPQWRLQAEFLQKLHAAVEQHRALKTQRTMEEASSILSHKMIMEEWSSGSEPEPEEPDKEVGIKKDAADGDFYGAEEEQPLVGAGGGCARAEPTKALPDHVAIHSGTLSQSRSQATPGTSHSITTKMRKRVPKPTHFILCVDTSGSMLNKDCKDSDGSMVSRLDAVLDTCKHFISSSLMHREDIYSVLTFNEESVLHISCKKAFDALEQLDKMKPEAQRQTLYSMGIRGIEAAVRRDEKKLPAHVVFLSDGEPTDPEKYLSDVMTLRRKHPQDQLKIYTIGFGEYGKVNANEGDFEYLQQLASMGNGHFQRCGASLESLAGAFTAVSSSISQVRSATRSSRGSREKSSQENPPSKSYITIPEVDEDDEEVSSDDDAEEGGDAGCQDPFVEQPAAPDGESTATKQRRIEFELPSTKEIFKDVNNKELWDVFQAARTTFKFDGKKFTKRPQVSRVYLRQKPFMRGGMRLAFGMLLEDGAKSRDQTHWMCGKRILGDVINQSATSFQAHTAFCKSTAVAQHFAKLFRIRLARVNRPVRFGFLDVELYSPIVTKENGYHFCGEKWLKGHFVKLNSNAGYVNQHEYAAHSDVAQAFSHFTFQASRGALMVVDLQGVCSGDGGSMYFVLTDPQVHSRGAHERFGRGDLGDQGIRAFFQHHRCGEYCKLIGLRSERHICDPTNIIKMPGAQACIDLFRNCRDFFSEMRRRCRASSILVPNEVFRDWQEIKVWATRKGGELAEKMLQDKLEDFYRTGRETVQVPSGCAWPVEKWEQQVKAWQTLSGAAIVLAPPNWRESGARELWVFAGASLADGVPDATTQRNACWRIRTSFEEEASLKPPADGQAEGSIGAASSAAAGSVDAASGRQEASLKPPADGQAEGSIGAASSAAAGSVDAASGRQEGASSGAAGADPPGIADGAVAAAPGGSAAASGEAGASSGASVLAADTAGGAPPPQAAATVAQQDAPAARSADTGSWTQYQDNQGQKYWYHEPDGRWFYESNPKWQRFLDEATGNHWWYNLETGDWFHEPRRPSRK